MDIQKAREKFAEINLKEGFYTEEELSITNLGVFECTAAEQDWEKWWECLIYYVEPMLQAHKVAVPEWISLEDEEPNIGETVLICWSDGFDVEPEKDFMDVDIDSGVHYWSNFENDEPTHWMPIPQPPKAQEQVG